MESWENPIKKKLRNGQPVFGVTITGNSVEVAVYPAGGIQHAMATHDIPPDA